MGQFKTLSDCPARQGQGQEKEMTEGHLPDLGRVLPVDKSGHLLRKDWIWMMRHNGMGNGGFGRC